jgi:hypothetical protein
MLPILLLLVVLAGCSKDVLKPYDDRIVGTWRIADVNRRGIGGDFDDVAFREGSLTFQEDGALVYQHPSGATYRGHWNIVKKFIGDDVQRTLQLSVVNPLTQEFRTQFYDEMVFWGTDHFRAVSVFGIQSYATHFRR